MARKPEAQFRGGVHKYLDSREVYFEGMANDYRGGTPDNYYEGCKDALWIEYKYLQNIPPVVDLTNQKAQVKLSPLQSKWITRAYGNNINVAVIIGCKKGGILLINERWNDPIERAFVNTLLMTRKELARWITHQVSR